VSPVTLNFLERKEGRKKEKKEAGSGRHWKKLGLRSAWGKKVSKTPSQPTS
jgi:hypothetical protein